MDRMKTLSLNPREDMLDRAAGELSVGERVVFEKLAKKGHDYWKDDKYKEIHI